MKLYRSEGGIFCLPRTTFLSESKSLDLLRRVLLKLHFTHLQFKDTFIKWSRLIYTSMISCSFACISLIFFLDAYS